MDNNELIKGLETVMSGLEKYSARTNLADRISKRYIYELSELAAKYVSSKQKDSSPSEAFGEFCDALRDVYRSPFYKSNGFEASLFCKLCAEELKKRGVDPMALLGDNGDIPSELKTCYLKNGFSDEAFKLFDRSIAVLLASYEESYSECAENVYDEATKACILPYETDDGVMSGISLLSDKYELKKIASCSVKTGNTLTKFGLFSSKLYKVAAPDTVDFTVFCSSIFEVSKILDTAYLLGFENGAYLQRTADVSGNMKHKFTFSGSSESIEGMVIYLSMFGHRAYISGIYKQITK